MARARNIKPGFFLNEELAELDPLCRLLFIGLWTLADHKGDLEWRPKRVKAQLLPYDECDIEALAINLDKSRFVTFYSHQGEQYLHINNFERHQNPHPNEKKGGSKIPAFKDKEAEVTENKGVANNQDESRQVIEGSQSNRADSPSLIPDSLTGESEKKFSSGDIRLAEHMHEKIKDIAPKAKEPNFEKWADLIRLMRERDGYELSEIRRVFEWANADDFWQSNILSPDKLRKQFTRLQLLANKQKQTIDWEQLVVQHAKKGETFEQTKARLQREQH